MLKELRLPWVIYSISNCVFVFLAESQAIHQVLYFRNNLLIHRTFWGRAKRHLLEVSEFAQLGFKNLPWLRSGPRTSGMNNLLRDHN